jgi:hypothetical protein
MSNNYFNVINFKSVRPGYLDDDFERAENDSTTNAAIIIGGNILAGGSNQYMK